MNWLRDLPVLVLGLGASGLAMARWCARCGARVTVWDSRESTPGDAALAAEWPGVVRIGGVLDPARLAGFELVLRSPGLAPHDERVAPLLDEARASAIGVLGELELFVRALAELKAAWGYAPQLLAITGTNGKTTTTAMTALLVERAGRRVAVAGNIGPTLLDTLSALLPVLPPPVDATAGAGEAGSEAGADTAAAPAAGDAAPDEAEAADTAADIDAAVDTDTAADAPAPPLDDDALVADALAALLPTARPVREPTPADALPEVWVLELSSFQLHEVRGFEPAAATVLNITQDHLDWHGDMAAYTAAKARVFGAAGVMVINRDDAAVEALVPQPLPAKGKARPRPLTRAIVRFGLDAPRRPGDFGLVTENGMTWLVRALPADDTVRRKPRAAARRAPAAAAAADAAAAPAEAWDHEDDEIHLQRLMPADALRVRGRHNAANALAALALATAIGCPLAPMLHGLREYSGEPHRVAFVTRIGEVEAFDDSKGTNVGATVAALQGLGADKAPGKLLIILGGDGKGQDFMPLREPLARHARAVATIGRDAAAIEAVLGPVPFQRHDSLAAAVAWCFDQAEPGDAVLLSPACASLDMFRHYAHRAEVFVQTVQALAIERGVVA